MLSKCFPAVSTVVFQELFEVKGKYEEEAMLREKAENFAAQVRIQNMQLEFYPVDSLTQDSAV